MFNIKWDNDKDHSNCYNCSSRFTIILRKHHCRKCGKIFCINCLKNFKVFNTSNHVCSNCCNILNDLVFVDKTELYYFNIEFKNLKDFFRQSLKNKKNNFTQTYNITNTTYTQTNSINKLESTTQTNNEEMKCKSLDIIDCINNASKKTESLNYVAEKEILKYLENKTKEKEKQLNQYQADLQEKEKQLNKYQADLQEKEKQLNQYQVDLEKQQEVDRFIQHEEVDTFIQNEEVDTFIQNEKIDTLIQNEEVGNYKNKQIIKMSTRDTVLKRKMDKKIQEENNYKNELENIHKNYKSEVKNAKNYKY